MIRCDPACYLLGAMLVLLLPLDWLLSAITAAMVHEGGHILAVRSFGGQIRSIRISVGGCVIECGELAFLPEIMAILAGPVGSLSLLAFRRILPQIAVCGLVQGLFNLLPLFPLDGGRILQRMLSRWFPAKASAIQKAICCAVLLLLLCLLWLS